MVVKEKTARERALDFAKNNVPKPAKRHGLQMEDNNSGYPDNDSRFSRHNNEDISQRRLQEMQYHMNEPMDYMEGNMIDSTGADNNTLNHLAQKHEQYADEIEKIKAMLGD